MALPASDYAPPAPRDVLEAFLSMETPPGYRAELIDGEIIVTPPPDGNHETASSKIIQQIVRRSSMDLDLSANKGLITPSGRFIPDLTVGPEGAFADKEPWMSTEGVLLVVEVTSAHPVRDRTDKRKGYAAAGIPLYLLVDRQQRAVVLHSDPDTEACDYLIVHNASFGKDVPLPEPFNFDLETSSL
ncbi:MAG TPA: Uma2 family endonuclease [Actinophytocola sp.]|uniref:Uma2 family endonuclease n=1 Tax=Actinophytocola sp. TaxID=1872138 RepID=UPI002DDD4E58|nr:Uma2 family endonuclease [Actinophytocola sp.]HEV2783718.1 Uma2 family endonuclease [Actinophytocola sp.]